MWQNSKHQGAGDASTAGLGAGDASNSGLDARGSSTTGLGAGGASTTGLGAGDASTAGLGTGVGAADDSEILTGFKETSAEEAVGAVLFSPSKPGGVGRPMLWLRATCQVGRSRGHTRGFCCECAVVMERSAVVVKVPQIRHSSTYAEWHT
jgi:hypothetical protein